MEKRNVSNFVGSELVVITFGITFLLLSFNAFS